MGWNARYGAADEYLSEAIGVLLHGQGPLRDRMQSASARLSLLQTSDFPSEELEKEWEAVEARLGRDETPPCRGVWAYTISRMTEDDIQQVLARLEDLRSSLRRRIEEGDRMDTA